VVAQGVGVGEKQLGLIAVFLTNHVVVKAEHK
jgi:hypothetical protein